MVEVFDRLFKQPEAKRPDNPSRDVRTGTTGSIAPVAAPMAAPVVAPVTLPGGSGKAKTVRPAAAAVASVPALSRDGPGRPLHNGFLAINLGSSDAKTLKDFGFAVGAQKSNSALGKSVTRVHPPTGKEAPQGKDWIQQLLSPKTYAPNYIHRLVPSGPGQPLAVPAVKTELVNMMSEVATCRGDRCAGRQLIGWNDQRLPGCSRGLRVGMIDTDVDHEHPAFPRRLKTGSFIPEGKEVAPNWHGTGVLAMMAGNPAGGTPGLIPQADFFVASVFYVDGDRRFATDTQSILDALDWMKQFDVKVINMSFAGPMDPLVQEAITNMARSGTVFVAAAGNEGPSAHPSYPAAYKPVVAVTAVTKDLRSYAYANRGDYVDVSAPGVDIWTAVPGMKEGYHTGTSFAAPFATAALATIYRQAPSHAKDSMLAALETKDLGPAGRDAIFGRGLLMAPKDCRVDVQTAGGKAPSPRPAASAKAPANQPEPEPEQATAPSPWQPSIVMSPASGRSPPPSAVGLSTGFR